VATPTTPTTTRSTKTVRRRLAIIVATLAASLGVYFILPSDMDDPARRTVAIFLIAGVFWATEVIPLFATSLCVIALQVLLLANQGGLAPTGDQPLSYSVFLEPFSSSIIILFMGGFLLSAAVTKYGIDRVLGAKMLRPFCRRPILLLYGVLGITAFFSMWISNTATTAMMLAIIAPLLRDIPEGDAFHRAVVLAVPFGANIGGMATPIGTPPNAVALAALRDAGIEMGFVDWMIVATPLTLILLAVVGVILYLFFRPAADLTIKPPHQPGPISTQGRWTLIILACAIAFWLTGKWHGINSAVVALMAAAALTALGVLDKRDVDSIDWNILILMWGGLSLGNAMIETNLVDYLVQLPIADLSGVGLAIAIVIMSVVLSTFMSNTATANLVIPMALALAGDQAPQMVILTALACSAAMAMPVSTPPNAMAFSTGKIPVSSLMWAGAMTGLIAVFILLLGYQIALPMLLDIG